MRRIVLPTLLVVVLLSACEKEVVEPPQRIRAVKTITVAERGSGETRQYPGVVEAVDTSSIGFEVTGMVQEVRVESGDRIDVGQVLVALDRQPFELAVVAATAALSRAKAQADEKKSAYEREHRIRAQDAGATTEKRIEQALAAYESTRQNVGYAGAQLDLAQRDLEKTELRATFNGTVAARNVDPFEEVHRGQPILELFAEGAMQVAVQIPEDMIEDVYVGQPTTMEFPTIEDRIFHGAVTEVGSAAQGANAFPVKATIGASDSRIRPGITAELSLKVSGQSSDDAHYLPIAALVPGEDESKRYVFVFDSATSTVKRTAVVSRSLVGDQAAIVEGIGSGDIVVVAGASFLRDGQEVKLLQSAPPASDG